MTEKHYIHDMCLLKMKSFDFDVVGDLYLPIFHIETLPEGKGVKKWRGLSFLLEEPTENLFFTIKEIAEIMEIIALSTNIEIVTFDSSLSTKTNLLNLLENAFTYDNDIRSLLVQKEVNTARKAIYKFSSFKVKVKDKEDDEINYYFFTKEDDINGFLEKMFFCSHGIVIEDIEIFSEKIIGPRNEPYLIRCQTKEISSDEKYFIKKRRAEALHITARVEASKSFKTKKAAQSYFNRYIKDDFGSNPDYKFTIITLDEAYLHE